MANYGSYHNSFIISWAYGHPIAIRHLETLWRKYDNFNIFADRPILAAMLQYSGQIYY